jgi:hypothetical protein
MVVKEKVVPRSTASSGVIQRYEQLSGDVAFLIAAVLGFVAGHPITEPSLDHEASGNIGTK